MQTGPSSVLINTFLIVVLVWLAVLATVLITLSKRRDILFPVKIFWSALIVFAPVAGLIAYLVYGPKKRI